MPQIKKKAKIPQKKKKSRIGIKVGFFLLGVAATLLLIGAYLLITGNQEEKTTEKKPIIQEPCKEPRIKKNITRTPTPTPIPEVTKAINIGDKKYNVNEEI